MASLSSQSNRSPSPIHSKHAHSTNSRNAESSSNPLLRRSFSGNSNSPLPKPPILTNHKRFEPSTPVNSPTEFAARRSVTKESSGLARSSLKDSEEKENAAKDHNVKDCKLQNQPKGSKNFMSPTISAASKFTPSPRKKVLVDRDDPLRTSMSLCNGKATFFSNVPRSTSESSEMRNECSVNSTDAEKPEKNDPVREDPPPPKAAKRVSFSDSLLDPQHETGASSSPVVSEPDGSNALDSKASFDAADSYFPPYDPVKNYLSPRPRFTHYKPNPRTEMLSTFGGRIEDSLINELSSETDCSEESQSGDSLEKGESAGDDASGDTVIGMEETEDDLLLVNETCESLLASKDLSDDGISEESRIPKAEKKPWLLSKLGIFSVLVMIVVAGVSISVANPPLLNEIMQKDLRFSDLKMNLDWIASNVKQLSVDSVASMSKLIDELQRRKELGPLRFANLTELEGKNPWVGNQFLNEEIMICKELQEKNEYDVTKTNEVLFEDAESYVEEADTDESSEDEIHAINEPAESDETYPETPHVIQEEEEMITTMVNNDVIRDENYQDEITCNVSLPDQETEPEAEMIEASPTLAEETNFEDIPNEANIDDSTAHAGDSILLSSSAEDVLTSVKAESITHEEVVVERQPLSRYATGICCLFATILLAIAASFVFIHKKSPRSAVQNPSLGMNKAADRETTIISRNLQTDADVSESCSSEMSSLQKKSASYTKKEEHMMNTSGENQKKAATKRLSSSSRRESLASSSSEFSFSPSYGSFTTYEKIPIKDANGEEKFLTPVRRSSRIRSHQQIMSS